MNHTAGTIRFGQAHVLRWPGVASPLDPVRARVTLAGEEVPGLAMRRFVYPFARCASGHGAPCSRPPSGHPMARHMAGQRRRPGRDVVARRRFTNKFLWHFGWGNGGPRRAMTSSVWRQNLKLMGRRGGGERHEGRGLWGSERLRAGRGVEGRMHEEKSKKEARKYGVEGGGRGVGLAGFRTNATAQRQGAGQRSGQTD